MTADRTNPLGLLLLVALLVSAASPAAPQTPQAPGATSAASGYVDQITTVGFYTKVGMGYGGTLTFEPTPIVLFKSGEALKNMAALKSGESLAALKAAQPKDWTQWRRAGKTIEIVGSKGWEALYFTKTMDRLPKGYRLNGTYRRLSGGGNLAIGGTSAVAVWSDVSFDNAGAFSSGGGASSSTQTEGAGSSTTVTTGSRAAGSRGSYDIDGYALKIVAEGRTELRMIVADPTDLKVVWLDGDGYIKK